jgi:uncharacterized protein (DUF362 family)
MLSTCSQPHSVVALAASPGTGYVPLAEPIEAPELSGGVKQSSSLATIRELFFNWGLDIKNFGTKSWNPLGVFISPGSTVVLKPNWVYHLNLSGDNLDCSLTHSSVITAILHYVAIANAGTVVLGDAPIQSCNFESLRLSLGLDDIEKEFHAQGMNLSVRDFRHTILPEGDYGTGRVESNRKDRYILFDLQTDSFLEPIAKDFELFRVTRYDPRLMRERHAPGRHQYLVAKDVIEAETIINLPKLKSHKKACVTGALKNVVGINGHKEFLPHHRKGGSVNGGDCYQGNSSLKKQVENLFDAANESNSRGLQRVLSRSAQLLLSTAMVFGEDENTEGSWYGNDTVWRTCLDLQKILRYGQLDGTLCGSPKRTIVSITDAIVGGQGEGPLSPKPIPSGFITGSTNPAAAEWVNARLMGFDPRKIPLIRESFGKFSHQISDCTQDEIRILASGVELSEDRIFPLRGGPFKPSEGWTGHCELELQSHSNVG